MRAPPPKKYNYAESKFREWYVNATPLERVLLENSLLDYRIKKEKLKCLGALPPENQSRYVYKVEAIFKEWEQEKKKQAEKKKGKK